MKRKNNRLIKAGIILMVILLSSFPKVTFAGSLSDTLPNTTVSGWDFSSSQHYHLGTRSCFYYYESSAIQTKYSSQMTGGINLWGNYVSMVLSPYSSSLLHISEDYAYGNNIATTYWTASSSTKHITSATIVIHTSKYDNLTQPEKNKVFAHEIGHVYGLGDLTETYQIMNGVFAAYNSITNNDKNGMNVMTHQHVHDNNTTGTYTFYNSNKHNVLCATCSGIYHQTHDYSASPYTQCSKCGYIITNK